GGSGTATGTNFWSTGGINLQNGVNVIRVVAVNTEGLATTATLTVMANLGGASPDIIRPSVTITLPTSNQTFSTTEPQISLGGWASDNVRVDSIKCSNSAGGTCTATGTSTWSAVANLVNGTNIITVSAYDAAGNVGSDTL